MEEVGKRGTLVLHKTNPFVAPIQKKNRTRLYRRGNMALINTDTGEVHNPEIAGFWAAEVVDSTKFVKLYVNGVKALAELTAAGTKVFEVLYRKMQDVIGTDQVYMSFGTVDQGITPMSKATYTRGLHELINKGFLAASPDLGLFWINPSFLWNGDRLAFLNEYYRKGSQAAIRLQERLEEEEKKRQQQVLPFADEGADEE